MVTTGPSKVTTGMYRESVNPLGLGQEWVYHDNDAHLRQGLVWEWVYHSERVSAAVSLNQGRCFPPCTCMSSHATRTGRPLCEHNEMPCSSIYAAEEIEILGHTFCTWNNGTLVPKRWKAGQRSKNKARMIIWALVYSRSDSIRASPQKGSAEFGRYMYMREDAYRRGKQAKVAVSWWCALIQTTVATCTWRPTNQGEMRFLESVKLLQWSKMDNTQLLLLQPQYVKGKFYLTPRELSRPIFQG